MLCWGNNRCYVEATTDAMLDQQPRLCCANIRSVVLKRRLDCFALLRGQNREDCLLDVEAVFRFVEDDGGRAVVDVFADLLAEVSGEAVHEVGVRLGDGHYVGIHLIRLEHFQAVFLFVFHAHADPHVGVNHVGVLGGLQRIGGELLRERLALRGEVVDDFLAGRELLRSAESDVDAQVRASKEPGVGHVAIGVAHEGDLAALHGAQVVAIGHLFGEREDVREDLARVRVIRQRIDDRHRAELRKVLEQRVLVAANDHAMQVARQHLCGVGHGFAAGDLRIARAEDHRMRAKLMQADFERHACAGAVLVEEHAPALPVEGLRGGGALALVLGSQLKNLADFLDAEVGNFQEVLHYNSENTLKIMSVAAWRSSSDAMRGGSKRRTLPPAGMVTRPASRSFTTMGRGSVLSARPTM